MRRVGWDNAVMELLTEVFSPSGNYVLRAEQANSPQNVFRWGYATRLVVRLLRGDRAWTVRIRHREHDYPGGSAVMARTVPSKAEAKVLLYDWAAQLNKGTTPAELSGPDQ